MFRAFRVPAASPKMLSATLLWAPPPAVARMKFARLNTLKACASNLMFTRSVNLKVLDRVMSAAQLPGPTKVLRPRLPTQVMHGVLNTGAAGWPEADTQFEFSGFASPVAHKPFAHWKRD